jgi:uncharacterized protein YdaT
MPWTDERYPPSMRRLPAPTRHKAIAIANALLEQGMEEGQAIRIAIAKAKSWAEAHLDLPTWAALPDGELPARPRSWHSP